MAENTFRLYNDLAWLWPMWGDAVGEYTDWCDFVTGLIRNYSEREAKTILNMGCGGGKNALNLKRDFQVTGIDLSETMLAQAAELNPECEFIHADMRTCSLGREFDCVLIDDSVSYMASRSELAAAFQVAYQHLGPGGVMVVSPDDTTETFEQNRTRVSHAESRTKPDNIDVVFVENSHDPDPTDETYEGTMVYLIREDGNLRVETDRHILGLFPLEVWRETLRETGFEIHEATFDESPNGTPTFACVKGK